MVELKKEELEKDVETAVSEIRKAEQQMKSAHDVIQRNWGIVAYCQEQMKKFKDDKKEEVKE